MNRIGPVVVVSLALALQGCATVALTLATAGVGIGMEAGVEHTLNGIVYKTFTASTNELRFATLKSFDRLVMPVTNDGKSEDGWKLTATASNRTIDVDFQSLTEQTTRMRVVANTGAIFFKDASTATEIINQTAQILADQQNAAKAKTKRKEPT